MHREELLLEIQERLSVDRQGAERDEIVSVLRSAAAGVERRMSQGVPPALYRSLSNVYTSLAVAERVVVEAWGRYHGSP